MRHPAFHRQMTCLALLAMLLLVLMPTAGRLLAARATAVDASAGWVELCTMSGLKLVKLAPRAIASVADMTGAAQAGAGQTDAGHATFGGDDCGYCPLLQAALALTVVLLLVDALTRRPAVDDWRRPCAALAPARTGLGSRGPPLHS